MPANDAILITLADLKAIERLAVQEAKLDILVGDFQKGRDHTEETLDKMFTLIRDIPGKVTDCKDTLEKDIKDSYMSKTDAKLMEQRFNNSVKSIKLWIVSTVSGCTGTGVFLLWLLNVNPVK